MEKYDFYSYSKDGDLYRIPLLEPYQVINTGYIEEPWFFTFPFKNNGLNREQVSINQVGVDKKDSLIVLYSDRIDLPGKMTEAWFVCDIKNKRDFYFTEKEKYTHFLDSTNTTIDLYKCVNVFNDFEKGNKWPW